MTDMASPVEAGAILKTLLSSIAAADKEPGLVRQYLEKGLERHKQRLSDLEQKNLQLQESIDKCVLASPGAALKLHASAHHGALTSPEAAHTSCARPVPARPCCRCPPFVPWQGALS